MADRAIGELTRATEMYDEDLFVLEQNAVAKSLAWDTFIRKATERLDGHGNVANIEYVAPAVGSLTGEIVFTMADGETYSLNIRDGRGIKSISNPVRVGLVDTYTITYTDNTTSSFSVTNGAQGVPGQKAYVHIKYAAQRPTSDSQMSDIADEWMGVATNNSETAPTSYTFYKWYKIRGESGEKAMLVSNMVEYAHDPSGDTPPSSGWQTEVPPPSSTSYLWTRTTLVFDSGDPVVAYGVSKIGSGGSGGGGVQSITVSNPDRDLMSNTPVTITESGTVTLQHQNNITAKTVQKVYPITFDKHGHIVSAGDAATADTIGAIKAPTSTPSIGDVLTWNGTAWVGDSQGSVTSVNGLTGDVQLSASNVGAVGDPSTKTAGDLLAYDGSAWAARSPFSDVLVESANIVQLSSNMAGKVVLLSAASAVTVTINANVCPVGTEIELCHYGDAASVTIGAGSGVNILSFNNALTIAGKYGIVAIKQIAENVWLASGALK